MNTREITFEALTEYGSGFSGGNGRSHDFTYEGFAVTRDSGGFWVHVARTHQNLRLESGQTLVTHSDGNAEVK